MMKLGKKEIAFVFAMAVMTGGCILAGCGFNGCFKKEGSALPEGAIKLEARVEEVYGNADGIVTIISDDGIYDSCVNLDRICGKRNLRCTVAGVVEFVENHQDEWNELLRHGAIELVSHSYHHVKMSEDSFIAKDLDDLTFEIVGADQWYEDWLGYEQIGFVCPENQMCKNGYKILGGNGFWAVRRGDRGLNSLSPEEGTQEGQWFNLKVQGICDEGADAQVRNHWVDTAIKDKAWLIEMWHNVMPEDDGKYQTILISDAEEHLDYVTQKAEANEIWVATYDEAIKYIREKQNSRLNAYISGDELFVSVELTNRKMSYETFNQPLTVSVVLPEGYTVGEAESVTQVDNVLSLDLLPGEQVVISVAFCGAQRPSLRF